jgi:hypothetical protein
MLIKRQTEPDRRKPELRVFNFYSKVAEETGLTIAEVDSIYSDYIQQLSEALPTANKVNIPNMGELRVNTRKLRVTFFKFIIYMCDILKDLEYPKREQRVEKCMRVMNNTLAKMIKDFENCSICNKKEHVSYMCVRNVVGNIYYNIDQISHMQDDLTKDIINRLKEMYETYAPRIIKKAEELGSVEFMEQYKTYMISIRPDLEHVWGNRKYTKEKIKSKYMTIDELEQIYIPQYDIKYYL